MSSRKYEKGSEPMSAHAALDHLRHGGHFYLRNKFTHNAWALGWQIRTLIAFANSNRLFPAWLIETKEPADAAKN